MAVARTRVRISLGLLRTILFLFVSLSFARLAFADNATGGPATEMSWHALHFVCSVVVGVYTWVASGQKAAERDVRALENRLATLEERMRHIPTEAEGRAVLIAMSAQQSKLEALIGQLETMSARFARYEEHMLARNQ